MNVKKLQVNISNNWKEKISTQHNSEIAKEAFDLLCGRCPKGCDGKLVVNVYDKKSLKINLSYDKSDQEFLHAKLYENLCYQVCEECKSTYQI